MTLIPRTQARLGRKFPGWAWQGRQRRAKGLTESDRRLPGGRIGVARWWENRRVICRFMELPLLL